MKPEGWYAANLFGNSGNDDLRQPRRRLPERRLRRRRPPGRRPSDRIKGRSGNDDFDDSDALFELKDSNPDDDGPNSNL